jgi:D-3-phosphoglycerate dehydrogenase
MKKKILVTPRSITKEQQYRTLKKQEEAGFQVVFSSPGIQPTEEELLKLLPDCVEYLAGVEPITEKGY